MERDRDESSYDFAFYADLMTVICEAPRYVITLASVVDTSDHEPFAHALVDLTMPYGRTVALIRKLIEAEFAASSDAGALLRRNSVASKVVSLLSRSVAQEYLHNFFGDIIKKIVEDETLSLEIDPNHAGDGQKSKLSPVEIRENKKLLLKYCTKILNRVCDPESLAAMPREIRAIACCIAEFARTHAGPERVSPLVGSFIMLRLFNPMLITPEIYGLLPKRKVPGKLARRNLTLITKIMQNLSNGQLFGAKEDYMQECNPFIDQNRGKMEQYLLSVTLDPSNLTPPFDDMLNMSLPRKVPAKPPTAALKELHFVHFLFHMHKDRLLSIYKNDADLVTLFQHLGSPPSIKSTTPLYKACQEENLEQMKALIREGTDLRSTVKSDPDWHPLFWCMNRSTRESDAKLSLDPKYLEMLDLLLQYGADCKTISRTRGYLPLHQFVRFGWRDKLVHLRIIAVLLARGRDVNFQATSGETALHLASVEGIDESVSFLLNNGADVNARNSRGDTPLHYAIQQGHGFPRVVSMLLTMGADTSAKGYAGKTARELAQQLKRGDILRIIDECETFPASPVSPRGTIMDLTLSGPASPRGVSDDHSSPAIPRRASAVVSNSIVARNTPEKSREGSNPKVASKEVKEVSTSAATAAAAASNSTSNNNNNNNNGVPPSPVKETKSSSGKELNKKEKKEKEEKEKRPSKKEKKEKEKKEKQDEQHASRSQSPPAKGKEPSTGSAPNAAKSLSGKHYASSIGTPLPGTVSSSSPSAGSPLSLSVGAAAAKRDASPSGGITRHPISADRDIVGIFGVSAPFSKGSSIRSLSKLLSLSEAGLAQYYGPERVRLIVRAQAYVRRHLAKRKAALVRMRISRKKELVDAGILDEIFESERAYVRDIKVMQSHFLMPLLNSIRSASNPRDVILPEEAVNVIFFELDVLVEMNSRLLFLMSQFAKQKSAVTLADIFGTLLTILKAYQKYFRNYPKATRALQVSQKTLKPFENFLSNAASQSDVRYDVKTYIAKPIMRATIYQHLVDKILKRIPTGHPEHEMMASLQQKIRRQTDLLEESRSNAENQLQVADLADKVAGAPDLCTPNRVLIREGELGVVQSLDKVYHCFLFNDLLLLTVPLKTHHKDSSARQSIFSSSNAKKQSAKNFLPSHLFESKNQFDMSNVYIYDVGDMEGGFVNCIQLVSLHSTADHDMVLSYTFLAQSEAEKDAWLRAFTKSPLRNVLFIK